MGKKTIRRNAFLRKRGQKMMDDHWARQQKINMKRLVGRDPNEVKPVTGKINGRDWRTYFPTPNKDSGFSFLEFTRRMESLQEDYPTRLYAQLKREVKRREKEEIKQRSAAAQDAKMKIQQISAETHGRMGKKGKKLTKEEKIRILREARKSKRRSVIMSMNNPYKTMNNQRKNSDQDDDDENDDDEDEDEEEESEDEKW